jgi:hypothetical protein
MGVPPSRRDLAVDVARNSLIDTANCGEEYESFLYGLLVPSPSDVSLLIVMECKEESLFQSEEIAKFLQEFGPSIKIVDSQINFLLSYVKLNCDNPTVKGDILSLVLILKSFEANLFNEWRLKPSSKINFKIPLAAGSQPVHATSIK